MGRTPAQKADDARFRAKQQLKDATKTGNKKAIEKAAKEVAALDNRKRS